MTKLAILTPTEQRIFDTPPKIHKIDRPRYFSVSPEIRRLAFNALRTDINRVGFILQLGYFRASGKFFVAEDFRKRDLQYVSGMLGIDKKIDIQHYSETSRKNHRETILSLSGWTLPDESDDKKLKSQAQWFIEQQLAPRKVLKALVEYCWNNKLSIPTYSKLLLTSPITSMNMKSNYLRSSRRDSLQNKTNHSKPCSILKTIRLLLHVRPLPA